MAACGIAIPLGYFEITEPGVTKVSSRSHLVGTTVAAMKIALSAFDRIGLTLLHPDQVVH